MRPLVLLTLLPLAACTVATSNATADSTPPIPGTCRSEALAQFTGQPASQELGERMLRASGARILRWVPQGGAVTMEFSPERITIQLDGSNRVERASCG
ncbi:MAG TPA: I78 family peptidase inhibitor [Sphingomicrobium sp.]|nr:I78 family peptidase inhibitor [Sphingomicrobium sp.]